MTFCIKLINSVLSNQVPEKTVNENKHIGYFISTTPNYSLEEPIILRKLVM